MGSLSIVTIHPALLALQDHALRQRSRPVATDDPAEMALCRRLALDMFEALYTSGGSGLAAPQVGVLLRIFIADPPQLASGPRVFLNPEIIARSEEQLIDAEGCLSIPGFRGHVARAASVTIRSANLQGETEEFVLLDFMARLAQHEIDHLDGVLYPDYLNVTDLEPSASAHLRRAQRALDQLDVAAPL
jgi:peptide deformylase